MRMRGLSLMETVVACGILTMVLLTVFTLLPGSLLAVQDARCTLTASQIGQSILEEARTVPASQMTNDVQRFAPVTVNHVDYTPTLEIFDVGTPAPNDPPLKGLRVVVVWSFHDTSRVVQYEVHVTEVRQ